MDEMPVIVRRCGEADARAACEVMHRSIKDLCALDHGNDSDVLKSWLSNKTPDQLAPHLRAEGCFAVVAGRGGAVEGFGLVGKDGEIKLCYVLPGAVRCGVGSALLKALEAQAAAWGLKQIALTSTRTAQRFYERHGFVRSGAPVTSMGVGHGQPMVKRLGP